MAKLPHYYAKISGGLHEYCRPNAVNLLTMTLQLEVLLPDIFKYNKVTAFANYVLQNQMIFF